MSGPGFSGRPRWYVVPALLELIGLPLIDQSLLLKSPGEAVGKKKKKRWMSE